MDVTDARDKHFKGLTEAGWDEAEKIEAELNGLGQAGFTERAALAFVIAVPAIRKRVPAATVAGIFDQALLCGLDAVLDMLSKKKPAARTRKGGCTLK